MLSYAVSMLVVAYPKRKTGLTLCAIIRGHETKPTAKDPFSQLENRWKSDMLVTKPICAGQFPVFPRKA